MRIGADPEIFLVDASGAFISAIDKIGGSKEEPRPIVELGRGFAVQEDNVAVEYNIPPAESSTELVKHIKSMMSYLEGEVRTMGLAFSKASAVSFPKNQLRDPRALQFGCEPDFNAWTENVNPKPKAADKNLRSCGGHVHVGAQVGDVLAAVRRMDLCLAVPSVFMDTGYLRKELYGKHGAFRPKHYGFEYRVLSNFWIFSDDHIRWVWNATEQALAMKDVPVEQDKDAIIDAIDNNNHDAARHLIDKYNLMVV